jgi:hypothetical protein
MGYTRKYHPPKVRVCEDCGRTGQLENWSSGMARAAYRCRHGVDPPPACSSCRGPLGPWQDAPLAPLPLRTARLLEKGVRARVDRIRQQLYL